MFLRETAAIRAPDMSTGLRAWFFLWRPSFEGRIGWGLLLASLTALFELMIIVAVALFFSSAVVTPTLAGLFTAATFIAGRSVGSLDFILRHQYFDAVKAIAKTVYWLLPHLHKFNIADQVVYGDRVDPWYLLLLMLYAFSYTGVVLVLSLLLFSRREFA